MYKKANYIFLLIKESTINIFKKMFKKCVEKLYRH